MKEIPVRTFKKQHQGELEKARSQKRSPSKVIKVKKRGRPLLLGGLNKMIQTFLKNTRSHGGVVNTAVALAVADASVERHPEQEFNQVQFFTCPCTRSLFHCKDFVRRAGMTGKVEISAGAKKEVELTFLHKIVNNVEKFQISSSLVLNLDQTNSKFLSMGKTTVAEKGSDSVPISSLSEKKYDCNFYHNFKLKISPDATGIWRENKFEFPIGFPCLLILNTTVMLQNP